MDITHEVDLTRLVYAMLEAVMRVSNNISSINGHDDHHVGGYVDQY